MAETEEANVMSLTVSLLSAYFANNTVPSSEVITLVEGTRKALLGGTSVVEVLADIQSGSPAAGSPEPTETASTSEPEYKAAVTIDQSLASPDHILSMIDGKPYKALKRHLSAHNLTPAEYRNRYQLPADYPIVAPGYSAARRQVALKLGLGNKGKTSVADAVQAPKLAGVGTAAAEPATEKPAAVRKPGTKKPKSAKSKPNSAAAAVAAPLSQEPSAPATEAKAATEVSPKPVSARKPRAKAAPKKAQTKRGVGKPKPEAVATATKPKQSRPRKAKPLDAAPAQPTP